MNYPTILLLSLKEIIFVFCVRRYLVGFNLFTSLDFSRISRYLDIVSKSLKIGLGIQAHPRDVVYSC